MPTTTTTKTIIALRHLFSTHGIPEQLVTDNGPQFTSAEFTEFTKLNGIQHIRSSPYNPATNGEAERFVHMFKEAMKSARGNGLTLSHQLNSFLLTYRTTPHSTTGMPPCELLMGRSLRTRWDLLKPDQERKRTVKHRQLKKSDRHNPRAKLKEFDIDKSVMVKNFGSGPDWIPGKIAWKLGPLTYHVHVSGGLIWKRHVDHVKRFHAGHAAPDTEPGFDVDIKTPQPVADTDRSPIRTDVELPPVVPLVHQTLNLSCLMRTI